MQVDVRPPEAASKNPRRLPSVEAEIALGGDLSQERKTTTTIYGSDDIAIRMFKNGCGPKARWIEAPDVADDLDTLFPLVGAAWEETGVVRFGMAGRADSKLTDYNALLQFASEWISQRNE